jgi:hypothetical protein
MKPSRTSINKINNLKKNKIKKTKTKAKKK